MNILINLFQDYQKVFDMDRSSHVAREALMVNDFVLSTECLLTWMHLSGYHIRKLSQCTMIFTLHVYVTWLYVTHLSINNNFQTKD